jgi:DNA polymerase-3 subunit gamma/tau
MRDAQVILDQISSFTEGKIDIEEASKVLGAVSDDVLFDLADSIKESSPVKALKVIEKITDDGKDMVQVALYLVEHFRNLSVMKVSHEASGMIDASEEKMKRYAEQARKFSVEEILYVIYTLSAALDFARKSGMPKAPFEVAFIKLTRAGGIAASGELLERLERLEKGLGRGEPSKPSLRATEPNSSLRATEPNLSLRATEGSEAIPRNDKKTGAIDQIISAWPAVLNCVKDRKISLAMYLKEGLPMELEHDKLSIEFPKSSQFHKDMVDTAECKSMISGAVKDICGMDIKIKFTLSESGSGDNAAKDAFEGSLDDPLSRGRNKEGADEPIINDALEIFGGEIEGRERKR